MNPGEFSQYPPLVAEYLHYLMAIKNKSNLTVMEYASDLRTFFRFMLCSRGMADANTPMASVDISKIDLEFIQSVTLYDAYRFLVYCREDRDNEASARARKVVSIKSFYRYLTVQTKQLETNPLQELESPKLKKSLPKYLTLEESKTLLSSVEGPFKERDYAILTLFLNCGLRLSELVSLNMHDIRDDHTMRVVGKGNKERTIYLNNACVNAVTQYIAVRPRDAVKDRDALFLSKRKQRISPKTVQYITKHYLEKSGLGNQGYSVHKLRHTAATLMYQHGNVDILLIKEMLGHENLSTTEIYTHVVDAQLRQAAQANPLSDMMLSERKKTDKQTIESGIQNGTDDAEA